MASSPPTSPASLPQRPMSGMMMKPPRSGSRMSMTSKVGGSSRASDEDGKTAVRVAVRVRPPLRPTDPGFDLIPQRFQRSMVQVTSPTSLAIDSPQGRKLFVFDRVFGEDVNQEGIWEYLVESVNAFVQGYNVSMLAYGQSGAGKSYTMGTSGPEQQGDLDVMGVIPRAASALFEKLEGPRPSFNNRNSMSGLRTPKGFSSPMNGQGSRTEKNWTLKATYVEIYNESLRDLLVPEHTPLHERSQVLIREDRGHILLTGLHQVEINSIDDLLGALNFGSMIRQTDSTAINAKSSRSHAVFSLNLVQRKSKSQTTPRAEKRMSVPLEAMTGGESWVTIDSKFHFVDLAGSERMKNTGAQGERAKEGISINAGLASLGKVISQLSSRQAGSHVSYRDSKLTRLLQDSLGGNAITYMIACVTPAEFHLSETLNTVQYAQRARAIQSKPRIQQVSDETDKQALIDRLKAEVAFLREQIRSTERGGDRRTNAANERPERSNEREIELQNQLLDTQESYTTLSHRHAKLISELTRARDGELADNQAHENNLGDSATERIKRSNSFAEAVEQVVLEYEKTIQSLEQSLSSTRTSLSSTETMLLEKETKCTYVETVNQQLQARLQKLMDRESSTENYLNDLEAKLDGHTTGEEKNSAIVIELRKEIARVRENEAACEDYISTLEERLAEADQDAELMQREIDRLEHVVERQRSLGKLDNLLYELDHIQKDDKNDDEDKTGAKSVAHSRNQSYASRRSRKDVILENGEEEDDAEREYNNATLSPQSVQRSETDGPVDNGESIEEDGAVRKSSRNISDTVYPPQSPAQSKFVADKLEDVTQELIDLRVEHEATVNEFDLLSAKYDEALRTLAELQDAVDEARHPSTRDSIQSVSSPNQTRPTSFLPDARVNELRNGDGQYSSSRSLSSELSLAGESTSTEVSDAEAAIKKSESGAVRDPAQNDETLAVEVEKLKKLAAEKEEAQRVLAEKYAKLEEQHIDTLDTVEELKAEVQKAKMNEANGTSIRSTASPVIRRKSSQNVMIIDRAHRSFASLRNIAAENFEGQPDVMQNFELNLNTAMHELHARSERVQELEADITAVKKEMETKMTIISGLTRERSSLKNSSPTDMSFVSTMRDQLLQSEHQINILREAHDKEVNKHKAAVEANAARVAELEQAHTQLNEVTRSRDATAAEAQLHKDIVTRLEQQIAEHENIVRSHQAGLDLLHANHAKQIEDIRSTSAAEHEAALADLKTQHSESLQSMENNLAEARGDLNKIATQVASALGVEVSVEKLQDRISDLLADQKALAMEQKKSGEYEAHVIELTKINDTVMKELSSVKAELASLLLQTADGAKFKDQHATVADQLAALKKEMAYLETKNKKNSRLVEELEDQLATNFDQHQMANNRLSSLQTERNSQLVEANAATVKLQAELDAMKEDYRKLQAKFDDAAPLNAAMAQRTSSMSNSVRKSNSVASLPSPPPGIPLPPVPGSNNMSVPPTPTGLRPASKELVSAQLYQDQEARIRSIEKHLHAEKELTKTLEEAMEDLEKQSNKMKADCDAWRRRAADLEAEVKELQERPEKENRWSLQQIEEEREKRKDAEIARAQLEERMNAFSKKKKKKGSLNCF